MRKLFAPILALALALSMGTMAFAEEVNQEGEQVTNPAYQSKLDQPANFDKEYVIAQGTAPAETFTFTFTPIAAENGHGEDIFETVIVPDIANVTTSFAEIAETATNKVPVTLKASDYPCTGVYTYRVEEVAGNTAGVTYNNTPLYLVVTILSDGTPTGQQYVAAIHYENAETGAKTGKVTNKYEAGTLSVTKQLEGNMADMDKKFKFTITLNAPANETVLSDVTYTVAGSEDVEAVSFVDGVATVEVMLGDDETINFNNIPEGVTYSITEANERYDYVIDAVGAGEEAVIAEAAPTVNAKINAGGDDRVIYTNKLGNETVDTAVSIDDAPFIAVIAVVAAAAVAFVVSRRRSSQF